MNQMGITKLCTLILLFELASHSSAQDLDDESALLQVDIKRHARSTSEASHEDEPLFFVYDIDPDTWQYGPTANGRYGPSDWGKVVNASACDEEGTQSPIDIVMSEAEQYPGLEGIFPLVESGCPEPEFLVSEYNTELVVPSACGQKLYLDLPNDGEAKRFYFKEFNYHSPSEHTINGKYFPLEVHFEHKAEDGQAFIVAVMVGVGNPTPGKAAYLDKIPKMSDLYQSLIDTKNGYYCYTGSFATPPCTKLTAWLIVNEPVMISQETLDRYRKALDLNPKKQLAPFGSIVGMPASKVPSFSDAAGSVRWETGLGSNIRPIQPLKGDSTMGDRAIRKFLPDGAKVTLA